MPFHGNGQWWQGLTWQERSQKARERAAKRVYKAKPCKTCWVPYTPTSAKQKQCEKCSPTIYARRKRERRWRRENLLCGSTDRLGSGT